MVSSISSIGSLDSTTSTSSVQALTEETKQKLEALGIDTSNITTEAQGLAALATAQATSEASSSTSTQETTDAANKASTQQSCPGQKPEWISLMEEIGVSPTGSIDGDKTAVSSALQSMTDTAEAKSLAAEFTSAGLSVSIDSSSEQSTQQQDAFAGQSQLAELNKHFLVD